MGQRSKVFDLPPEVREELNERLVSTGFQGYSALAEWLSERGYNVSRSSVHRYGQDLQEEFEEAMGNVRKTTEMAKAMADAVEDDEGNLIDATARIVQEQLLRVSLALRKAEHDPEVSAHHLAKVSKALTNLGRVSIAQKKHAKEVRQEVAQEAAEAADSAMAGQGMSREAIDTIKREILGIAG
ncbi:DUF3486 family protein [Modicisalibacter sp. MOD 31.J]|uniref:DUF3486 family protein n=1 Tax=Modicisalibacter sp. MOD 31.J TaxID=2831897 RepID=UPI001CCEECC6|nr:DUF3486 family protein [Modicisalibacter sp. MOD 31.J]MBZ9574405.1 DUF3486 family protein [Modicisalibacter sp. MOD 31.J]